MVTVSVVELDSRKLSSWGLAHQWSCELETLRRENFCKRVGALCRGGTHNRESSQTGICISYPIEGNYQGYKRLREANSMVFVFCAWKTETTRGTNAYRMREKGIYAHKHAMERLKLKVSCSIIRVTKKI